MTQIRSITAYLPAVNAIEPTHAPFRRSIGLLLMLVCGGLFAAAQDSEPVVSSIFDMEEEQFVAEIVAVEGIGFSDCTARDAVIPARGQRSLAIEIGATAAGAAVTVELHGRDEILFDDAQRVGVYVWINEGDAVVCLRIRDAAGRVFESNQQAVRQHKRWQHLTADLHAKVWKLVGQSRRAQEQIDPARAADATAHPDEPVWPIAVSGMRVIAPDVGRQTIFLDDVEVEHTAPPQETVRGLFRFNQPIQLYAPGSNVGASLFVENLQRKRALNLSISLSWQRANGLEIKSQRAEMNLPPSSSEYRSRQSVDFSQKIDQPGLYRLVARIQGARWPQAKVVETGLAVLQSNRGLPRGRSTLFAVRSGLLDDPRPDQELELQLADEIGVELFAIETLWRQIESKPGVYGFASLEPVVNGLIKRNIIPMISLADPQSTDTTPDPARTAERRRAAFSAMVEHFGARVKYYEARPESGTLDAAAWQDLQQALSKLRPNIVLIGPQADLSAAIRSGTMPSEPAVFVSHGSSMDTLRQLGSTRAPGTHKWKPADWWLLDPPAVDGIGTLSDATALLRHYFTAASANISGLMYFDLRDDTNDPHHPERMRGLVRRDFSPKAAMLGFANAAALIGGAQYAGPVPNAPEDYESFAFQGSARQIAALFPRTVQGTGQVLSIIQTQGGTLHAMDAERREVPLITVTNPPLVSAATPLFVELITDKLTNEFNLSFAPAWLRIPSNVNCAATGAFSIELTAPTALRKSYIEVVVPKNSGLKSSVGTRAIKADAGQVVKIDCDLTREPAYRDVPARISVNVSIEGRSVTLPVEIQPILSVAAGSLESGDQKHLVGRLRPVTATDSDSTAGAAPSGLAMLAGFTPGTLTVGIELPKNASAESILTLSLAVEDAASAIELTVRNPALDPQLSTSPLPAGRPSPILEAGAARPQRNQWLTLKIPSQSLGLPRFAESTRLIATCRLDDRAQQSGVNSFQLGGNADSDDRPRLVLNLAG